MSMENWNAFIKRILSERPDKADKGDRGSLHTQLNIIKRVKNNDNFSEKERSKDGESK